MYMDNHIKLKNGILQNLREKHIPQKILDLVDCLVIV